jgi:hypothetical protein
MAKNARRKRRYTSRGVGAAAYLLWYRRKGLDEADIFIGVYSSEEQATEAIERLRNKKGFVDFPQGFEVYSYKLDRDNWEDGFKFVE